MYIAERDEVMKRELIDRNSLFIPSDENEYEELVQFADDVMNAEVITEQEIVKPYLEKLKKQIEEYKVRQLSVAIGVEDLETGKEVALEYVLNLIDNLLSGGGEKDAIDH